MGTELTPSRTRDTGVTLVELLVVVAVMAVLAVGVSLAAMRRGDAAAQSDQEWFRSQFQTLQQLAIEGRNSKGLSLSPNGLQMARRTAEGWTINPPIRRWRGKVTLAVQGRNTARGVPDIILLANGQTTAFEVLFTSQQQPPRRCRTDGWTGLTCDGA